VAFGDALRGGATGGATVVLNVDTSEMVRLERAEAQWRESVGQMSREALRLDLAQDRLRKSLAQYGAESAQAKRATIALRDAEEQAARAADRQAREMRDLERAQRGATISTRSLVRSAVGLASAYVGAQGLVYAVRTAISAAKEEQNVRGQTKVALDALGISYDEYIRRIDAVIRAQAKLGFDDEALMQTFQMFVRSTRDVNKALELNALAIDVARGRYIDLEQAAQIVNKANLGMSGALRRIGIDVDRTATRTELLAALQRAYGRAAEEASDDAVAASDRLRVEWENLMEIVGMGLLPAVTSLSDRLSRYLGDAENQRRIQERVNRAIETGEQVVRGFAGGLRLVRDTLRPLVDLLGGAENAAKLFVAAFAAGKILAIVRGLGALRTAIAILGPTSARSAAVSVAALNTIGTAAAVNAGRVAVLRAALLSLVPSAGTVAAASAAAIVSTPGASGAKEGTRRSIRGKLLAGEYAERYPRITAVAQRAVREGLDALTPTERQAFRVAWQATSEKDLAAAEGMLAREGSHAAPDTLDPRRPGVSSPQQTRRGASGASASTRGTGNSERPPARTIEDILLDQARAQATPGRADDLRFHREALGYYQRRIDALERRKRLTAQQKQELRTLYEQVASEQQAIESIVSEGEARLEAQREAAAERERARLERVRRKAAADAERARRLFEQAQVGRQGWTRQGMRRAALAGLRERRTGDRDGEGFSLEDWRRMSFEFLRDLHGLIGQFGSNVDLGSAQVATNTWTLAQLTREQNRELRKLTSGISHPASRYAGNELAAAAWGVGL
jgi:hypothetical protein